MGTGLQVWSETAALNASSDTNINWMEGMAPSQINDSARAEMASAAKWRDDNSGTLLTSGSTTAYNVTSNQISTGNTEGYTLTVKFHATNDSSATLSSDGNTAAVLQIIAGSNVTGGEFQEGSVWRFKYDFASTGWIAQGGAIGAGSIGINAVSYSKIQNENTGSILGNVQGVSWPPQEITIGSGLVLSAGTTSTQAGNFTSTTTSTAIPYTISAPAFPPTAAHKNLSIKVTGVTSATCAADFATLATSGSSAFQTVALSGAVNLATNGAVNTLDTGNLAASTWYAIYGIATAAATATGFLASASFTSPTMPSGYTYKARLGALVTSSSTTPGLMGTYQYGRRTQYIVGLANTAVSVVMASGTAGTYSAGSPTLATVSTTNFVPSTAAVINCVGWLGYKGGSGSNMLVAPSTNYSGTNNGPSGSNGMIFPYYSQTSTNQPNFFSIVLEAPSLAWCSNAAGGAICVTGWEDNI